MLEADTEVDMGRAVRANRSSAWDADLMAGTARPMEAGVDIGRAVRANRSSAWDADLMAGTARPMEAGVDIGRAVRAASVRLEGQPRLDAGAV